ncbi:MAG: hypothetical protein NVS4B12_28290 [Ktedonobacteraceae bacterium]
MNTLYAEDFFIYVPSWHEQEMPTHVTWERITLEEQVVVYTHMLDEEPLVATNVSQMAVGVSFMTPFSQRTMIESIGCHE